ncbi:MAG: hypothetical protein LC768_14080 [Acidobacteria bacterium]|nr:hypothetical protein [Acidobacteriota bacterium]MCA1639441.1 hypothetical protein [Acidobacteriota bacterium]
MSKQLSIAQIFLWLFVVTLGIMIGGGLYEQLVVMPLWQTAPPDSVTAYYQHNDRQSAVCAEPGRQILGVHYAAHRLVGDWNFAFGFEDAPGASQLADCGNCPDSYHFCVHDCLVYTEHH